MATMALLVISPAGVCACSCDGVYVCGGACVYVLGRRMDSEVLRVIQTVSQCGQANLAVSLVKNDVKGSHKGIAEDPEILAALRQTGNALLLSPPVRLPDHVKARRHGVLDATYVKHQVWLVIQVGAVRVEVQCVMDIGNILRWPDNQRGAGIDDGVASALILAGQRDAGGVNVDAIKDNVVIKVGRATSFTLW